MTPASSPPAGGAVTAPLSALPYPWGTLTPALRRRALTRRPRRRGHAVRGGCAGSAAGRPPRRWPRGRRPGLSPGPSGTCPRISVACGRRVGAALGLALWCRRLRRRRRGEDPWGRRPRPPHQPDAPVTPHAAALRPRRLRARGTSRPGVMGGGGCGQPCTCQAKRRHRPALQRVRLQGTFQTVQPGRAREPQPAGPRPYQAPARRPPKGQALRGLRGAARAPVRPPWGAPRASGFQPRPLPKGALASVWFGGRFGT